MELTAKQKTTLKKWGSKGGNLAANASINLDKNINHKSHLKKINKAYQTNLKNSKDLYQFLNEKRTQQINLKTTQKQQEALRIKAKKDLARLKREEKIQRKETKKARYNSENVALRTTTALYGDGNSVYNLLQRAYQQHRTITIRYVVNGEIKVDKTYDWFGVNGSFASYWKSVGKYDWYRQSNINVFEDNDHQGTIVWGVGLQPGFTSKASTIAQLFKNGITNCLLTPIRIWAEQRQLDVKSKKSLDYYNTLLKKLHLYIEKYKNGVPEDEISNIANDLRVDITIHLPFQKEWVKGRSHNRAYYHFNYINTKLNHVEFDELTKHTEPEYLTLKQMNDKQNELDLSNTYYTYKKNGTKRATALFTLSTAYKLKNDYSVIVAEWENDYKLDGCILDDFYDKDISKFVRQGTHFNETYDYDIIEYYEDEEEDQVEGITYYNGKQPNYESINYDKLNHIDMKKAYTNFKLSSYYEGFLGKITDFRKTDNMDHLGMYRIKNLKNIPPYIKRLGIYTNFNVYPSPELKYLKKHNVEFDIIEGCWGSTIDFEFSKEMMMKDEEGVSYYAKWVGQQFCYFPLKSFFMKGNEEFFHQILQEFKETATITIWEDEIKVSYLNSHNYHKSHIASFITSYMRLNVLEQMEEIYYNPNTELVRVVVDGIYFYENDRPQFNTNIELKNCFRWENKDLTDNIGSDKSYISNNEVPNEHIETQMVLQNKYPRELAKNILSYIITNPKREHNMREAHIGQGGSGKTSYNLSDKGLVKVGFFPPSWKLSRNKQNEFYNKIRCYVWAKLLMNDPEQIRWVRKNFNVLIIDEISMMKECDKLFIFKHYGDMKLIFCGDPKYQLPPVVIRADTDKSGYYQMKTNDLHIVYYNQNYRVKCDILDKVLNGMRNQMDLVRKGELTRKYVLDNLKEIFTDVNFVLKDVPNSYKPQDMILVRTHIAKDEYTEKFKDKEKYYITKSNRVVSNGEIVYEKPTTTTSFRLQHAFTIHSIQGETAYHNLFIDMKKLTSLEAIYTALSRARYFKQIKVIY